MRQRRASPRCFIFLIYLTGQADPHRPTQTNTDILSERPAPSNKVISQRNIVLYYFFWIFFVWATSTRLSLSQAVPARTFYLSNWGSDEFSSCRLARDFLPNVGFRSSIQPTIILALWCTSGKVETQHGLCFLLGCRAGLDLARRRLCRPIQFFNYLTSRPINYLTI